MQKKLRLWLEPGNPYPTKSSPDTGTVYIGMCKWIMALMKNLTTRHYSATVVVTLQLAFRLGSVS